MALFQRRRIPIDEYDDEPRPSWISEHLPFVFISIGIVLIALVAFIITIVISNNTPIAKLSSAVSKSFDSGCDFQIEAKRSGEKLLGYDGSFDVSTQPQGVTLIYDADMVDYTYTGVVLTHQGLSYSGALIGDQWTVSDATTGVLDFLDFYTDFQNRTFDTNALMRFLNITGKYSSREFSTLMKKILSRFYTENSMTGMKIISDKDGSLEYAYSIDLYALLTLIKEDGASIFQRSTDYDAFCEKLEENRNTIENAKFALSFKIDKDGRLSAVSMSTDSRIDSYSLDITFSHFGEMTHQIPDSFYPAAGIELTAEETFEETGTEDSSAGTETVIEVQTEPVTEPSSEEDQTQEPPQEQSEESSQEENEESQEE